MCPRVIPVATEYRATTQTLPPYPSLRVPFGANRPTGCHAATLAFQLAIFFHLREHGPNPLSANTGTLTLYIAQAKFAWTLTDRIANQLCFGSFGLGDLTDALLEFLIGVLEYAEDVVDEGPGIVSALVPTDRALLERFVVSILVLLDQSLQANVTPYLHSGLVCLQQQCQARDTTVAVPERVDAKEIQVERRQSNSGRCPLLAQASIPRIYQLCHCSRRLVCGRRFEADTFPTVGVALDDVAVPFLILACVPDLPSCHSVHALESVFTSGDFGRLLVYPRQRIAIAADLFFIPVAEKRLGRDQHTLYARGLDGDALNP